MKLQARVGKICFTLAIGKKVGKMVHTTMCTKPINETTPAASPASPPIPQELQEYAQEVRESIESGEPKIFRNSSQAHAAVLMQLFCEAAQRYAYIYCGRLNAVVYGGLWPVIRAALDRGVDVRVVTEQRELQAEELARELRGKEVLRTLPPGTKLPEGMPHFAVFDDRLSRMETDKERRTAVVRTNVADDDYVGKGRIALMHSVFTSLWENARPAEA